MANLVVIGGVALDYLSKVKDASAKVTQVLEYSENLGGMAYNTAVTAAQLGVKTSLVSAVGADFPKAPKAKNLEFALTKTKGKTTRSFLFFDGRDERIYFYRGAYHEIDVAKAKAVIAKSKWVHFAGVAPCFSELVKAAVKGKKTISTNLGYDLFHYDPKDKLISDLVDNSDYLVLSAKELEYLKRAPEKLGKKACIITMGRWGSLLFEGTKRVRVPTYYVRVKSPFGAGDTYTGTLISCLMRGMGLADAAKRASAAGSFAVEEQSTTPKLSWGKIEKRAALL